MRSNESDVYLEQIVSYIEQIRQFTKNFTLADPEMLWATVQDDLDALYAAAKTELLSKE